MGAATAVSEAPRVSQVQNNSFTALTGVSGASTITASATPTPAAYVEGQRFAFTAVGANAASPTLNVSSLGANLIFWNNATCTSSTWKNGDRIEVTYLATSASTASATGFHVVGHSGFVPQSLIHLYAAAATQITARGDLFVGTTANAVGILARGTDDQILVATASNSNGVSWKNPGAAGSSMPFLTETTASATASVIFTSQLNWTEFDEYEFHCFNILPASNGGTLLVTVSEDAGSSYIAANYFYRQTLFGDNGTDYSRNGTAAAWNITDATLGISNAGFGLSCVIRLLRPAQVLRHLMTCRDIGYAASATANIVAGDGACLVNGTPAALNGIKFAMASGNITSGLIRVYGIRKA